MTWTLAEIPCVTYKRNSLAAVIVQLRFRPVLKIREGKGVPEFQEAIRYRFPGYGTIDTQEVEITEAGAQVHNEIVHQFHAESEPTALSLGTAAVVLEYKEHHSRAVLLSDLALAMAALEAIYAPIIPVRLGVRYVNLIRKTVISKDLDRQVEWSDLLSEGFASVPGGIASLDETTAFMVETSSACARGRMTVRHGVLIPPPNIPDREPQFRLDTDRFIDTSFKSSDVVPLAKEFVLDIFRVFATAAGDVLKEWMGPGVGGTE